jgi:hypothetical protein
MNDLFGLLNDLRDLVAQLIRVGGGATIRTVRIVMRRLSNAARLAVLLPIVLLLAAMAGYEYAQYAVPILTIVIIVIVMWRLTSPVSLGILIASATLPSEIELLEKFACEIKKVTRILRIIFGLELLAAIYCCTIPIANDPRSGLVLVLIVAGIFCFAGIKKWEWVVVILVVAFVAITLILCLGGRGKVFAGKSSDGQQATNGDIKKKSPAGHPATDTGGSNRNIPKALCNGRASDCPGGKQAEHDTTSASTPAPVMGAAQTFDGLDLIISKPCHRLNRGTIQCDGYAINENGRPVVFSLEEGGKATDNEGNQVKISRVTGIQFGSNGDWQAELDEGVRINFHLTFDDLSLGSAKSVQIQLNTSRGGKDYGMTKLFDPVPIS